MAQQEFSKRGDLSHHVIIDGRSKLSVSGVEDVESFDESQLILYTNRGVLTVTGSDLRMEKLSLDGGELSVNGQVHSLRYDDDTPAGGGFWSRLFR